MARRSLPPPLVPRQPKTELGWAMQQLRQVYVREVAREFGCSASHISRVERGDTKPSLALVSGAVAFVLMLIALITGAGVSVFLLVIAALATGNGTVIFLFVIVFAGSVSMLFRRAS